MNSVNKTENKSNSGTFADLNSLIQLRMDARLLKLDLNRGARSILAGQYGSKFRGRGMDYAESRHYQPGDDVRSIDWRLTARMGDTFTKVFVEERERPVFLMLDFSPSVYFGTRETFKSVNAARAASLLSWTAISNGDRLGGVIVAHGQLTDLKPKAGRRGALAMINALSVATAQKPDYSLSPGFNQALIHLNAVVHPSSLVFMFSDFYHMDQTSEKLITKIRQHNDIVACQLVDPIERTPPVAGRYAITDSVSGRNSTVLNTADKRVRKRYLNIYDKRKQQLDQIMSSMRIPVIELVNGQSVTEVMQSVFGKSVSTKS
jgi:uncharacterized protein (DUF58 family)